MAKTSDHEQYRTKLTELQFWVTRQGGTEQPGTGTYTAHEAPGVYRCICCESTLFASEDKFDAGCGWPSFANHTGDETVRFVEDRSHGGLRTEVICTNCEAHLGHIFDDGPTESRLRYCINSAALEFQDASE